MCESAPEDAGSRYSPFSDRTFHYGLCRQCDLGLVVDPRDDYENLYDEAYYAGRGADPTIDYIAEMGDPGTIRNLEWDGLRQVLGPLDRGLRVLDFGCGLGGLPRYLRAAGWNADGYEDEGFARDWMTRNGLSVVERLEPASYDVIFAIEVVEHLIDPLPVLRLLRESLRPGGRLVMTTGNLAKARKPLSEWTYASVPDVHVTFWTPRSWDRALGLAGFVGREHTRLPAAVTQYKILKALPPVARPLARVPALWRIPAAAVDRRYGVSAFADGELSSAAESGGSRGFFDALRSPPGAAKAPEFDAGWRVSQQESISHLTYFDFQGSSWSDDLEEIHEESSRDHFIDVLTRDSLVAAIKPAMPPRGVVADLGCSTGYLLEDLERAYPWAQLVGVDVIAAGLRKAHAEVADAALFLADVCDLPFGAGTVDAIVSANMLEHVADDSAALGEILRILAPGGIAAFVVPFGKGLYDYYDRFLGHERRYARGELAGKAREAGFDVIAVDHLGQLLYPPFWLVKKRNRRTRDNLRGDALRAQVEKDIAGTSNSKLGAAACRVERALVRRRVRAPVGIRELVVVRKPTLGPRV